MKILYRLKQILPVLLCFILFSACVPSQQTNTTTTSDLLENTTTATVLGTRSTAVATTTVTTTPKPTTTTLNNTTTTVQPAPTTVVRKTAPLLQRNDIELTFNYESENYDVLRQAILKEFPSEKNLSEFDVNKAKCMEDGHLYKLGMDFGVVFTRKINGCITESKYSFYFDATGKLLRFDYRNPIYDASAVKPPRVATEKEIEQAKKTEAARVPENCVILEQEISASSYNIGLDECYFTVNTIYASKKSVEEYSNENSPLYGKEPPRAMISEKYIIPR